MTISTDERIDDALPCDCAEPLAGNYFVSVYPPFSCWTCEQLPRLKQALADGPPPESPAGLGLYTHIPFCVQRCDYCYYRSYDDVSRDRIETYIDAVLAELTLYRKQAVLAARTVDFVYFGGGTPSLLSAEQIERLLQGVQAIFPWSDAKEITFECAPKTATGRRLTALSATGVTRISLGAQQLNDAVLKQNGRVHMVRDIRRAYEEVRRVGFATVNLDLMVGLVGETESTFFESLEQTIELQPDSVTIYQLEIPPNTPLFHMLRDGDLASEQAPWSVKRRRMTDAFARLEEAGYTIRSAYAAVRDPDAHRFLYQDAQYRGSDLLGVGVASFSYFAGVHYQNRTSLDDYLMTVAAGGLPLSRAHALSDEERLVREFVLQLKLGGVDREDFRRKFRVDILERFAGPLGQLAARDWLTLNDAGVTLRREALVRVDRLIPAFYLPEHHAASYW